MGLFWGDVEVAIAKSLLDELSNYSVCCQIKNECIIWHGACRAVDHAI